MRASLSSMIYLELNMVSLLCILLQIENQEQHTGGASDFEQVLPNVLQHVLRTQTHLKENQPLDYSQQCESEGISHIEPVHSFFKD
jgi:hypothetical protein